jgi:hypothetical protein
MPCFQHGDPVIGYWLRLGSHQEALLLGPTLNTAGTTGSCACQLKQHSVPGKQVSKEKAESCACAQVIQQAAQTECIADSSVSCTNRRMMLQQVVAKLLPGCDSLSTEVQQYRLDPDRLGGPPDCMKRAAYAGKLSGTGSCFALHVPVAQRHYNTAQTSTRTLQAGLPLYSLQHPRALADIAPVTTSLRIHSWLCNQPTSQHLHCS